mmetsp:Transcript_22531/g.54874  ORF Transcript_22531/g.54874 Transcript_22531/m.54874 type:complete len:211 (+) Transcript_22531:5340-5972(+)
MDSGHTAFCTCSNISSGLPAVSLKICTFSCGMKWHRLSSMMLLSCVNLVMSTCFFGLPFMNQLDPPELLISRLMCISSPPLWCSQISTVPLLCPLLMNPVSLLRSMILMLPPRPKQMAATMVLLPDPFGPTMRLSCGPGSSSTSSYARKSLILIFAIVALKGASAPFPPPSPACLFGGDGSLPPAPSSPPALSRLRFAAPAPRPVGAIRP